MNFDELIDIRPNVRLADLIQLFLLGYDDKIYFDINLGDTEYEHIRIIDPVLEPLYEYKVAYLEESDYTSNSIFSVSLVKGD